MQAIPPLEDILNSISQDNPGIQNIIQRRKIQGPEVSG
jgi:hypothetical protein